MKKNYTASCIKKELLFKHAVHTSRGGMTSHTVHYIKLEHLGNTGWGEAAPLPALSKDATPDLEIKLKEICDAISQGEQPEAFYSEQMPSVSFAIETALLSVRSNNPFHLFSSDFIAGKPIAINGLVWMSDADTMLKEAFEKIDAGYTCIKLKVGALDFDSECRLLETIRKKNKSITLRLDANGAFTPDEALKKIKELSRFGIHSLEQPVKAGQQELMGEICAQSKIPIALDEELISLSLSNAERILRQIKPDFLILKPTLLGGLGSCDNWIKLADKLEIGYWATSALESNIALNAIAQWIAAKKPSLPQGLGTGALYQNNITSPLHASKGYLQYLSEENWEMPL